MPGYENQFFSALVEVQLLGAPQRRLQPLDSFLKSPLGVETGYVQIHYQLTGKAGQMSHPKDWTVLDEEGTEGVDTHALRFQARPDVPSDVDLRFRVYAAPGGTHGGNPEDFLLVNDGSGKRLGPADIAPADASTKPATGSIHGTVFEDANADGTFDAGEAPIGGATVYLDLDHDGVLDAGEPRQLSAPEDGTYLFQNIAPGTYQVRELTPPGFLSKPTVPNEGFYSLSVTAGRRLRNVDFGNVRPGTLSGVYVSGATWTTDFMNYLGSSGMGDGAGYRLGLAALFRVVPWTNLDTISLRFNRPVEVGAADLSVSGATRLGYDVADFKYDDATYTASWRLNRNVVSDRLRVTFRSPGVAGARESSFGLNVLGGDATGDGGVNALDLAYIKQRLNRTVGDVGELGVPTRRAMYSIFADLNSDARVNALDLSAAKQRLNRHLPIILPPPVPVTPIDPSDVLELTAITKEVFSEAGIM